MGKKEPPDDFLADYKEWVDHRHNPYYWAGRISDFSLRAWRNTARYRMRDGVIVLIIGTILILVGSCLLWGIWVKDVDLNILPAVILTAALGIIAVYRGVHIIRQKGHEIDHEE